jgi:hypothetical protein
MGERLSTLSALCVLCGEMEKKEQHGSGEEERLDAEEIDLRREEADEREQKGEVGEGWRGAGEPFLQKVYRARGRAAAEQSGEKDAGPRVEEGKTLWLRLEEIAGQPGAIDTAAGGGGDRFDSFQHGQ